MEKTKYELKAEVETSMALPKTLQAETSMLPMGGAIVPMYPVYGRDMTERRVWVATFLDRDEASALIQASKVFGRHVNGAVIADQKPATQESTDGAGTDSGESPQAAN